MSNNNNNGTRDQKEREKQRQQQGNGEKRPGANWTRRGSPEDSRKNKSPEKEDGGEEKTEVVADGQQQEAFQREISGSTPERRRKAKNNNNNKKRNKSTTSPAAADALTDDFDSVTASDMAFPPDLERQTHAQRQPGAFAQQGIGSGMLNRHSDVSSTQGSGHLNTSSERQQQPQSNNNDFVVSEARLASSETELPRARAVRSSMRASAYRPGSAVYTQGPPQPKPPMAEAEPLDEAILKRKRWTKKSITCLIVAALILVGLAVGLTLLLGGNNNTTPVPVDDAEATLADVTSAFATSLIDPLAFATYHSVQFGFATEGCNEWDWSDLILSCVGATDNLTTVVILDVSSSDLICERESGNRNLIECFPDETLEWSNFSGSLLAACASNVADSGESHLALQVAQEVSDAGDCAAPVTNNNDVFAGTGGSQTIVRGDSYQWMSAGRFCNALATASNPSLLELFPNYQCEQGTHLQFPSDSTLLQPTLSNHSFCATWGECVATRTCLDDNDAGSCQGATACNTVNNVVEMSNPKAAAEFASCVYTKDSAANNNNQSFWVYDKNRMWQLVDGTYNYRVQDVLPPALQSKLRP